MAMWNPWRGCHKHSEGCRYCYIHKGDFKRGIDTDFLVEDADEWRLECWQMIRERSDLHFLFLTRRIERFMVSKGWRLLICMMPN